MNDFKKGHIVKFLVRVDGGDKIGRVTKVQGDLIWVLTLGTTTQTRQFIPEELSMYDNQDIPWLR